VRAYPTQPGGPRISLTNGIRGDQTEAPVVP
jgi:hypothetical protein